MMRTYARIWNGRVVELFETDLDITKLFHPDLIWTDVLTSSPCPGRGGWLSATRLLRTPNCRSATDWKRF